MDDNYADGKNGNGDTSKAKDKSNDTVGKLSDGGNVCYCVETVDGDELVYSSISKAQAFSSVRGIERLTARELLSPASLREWRQWRQSQ
jgi:hypothetical protein